MPSYAIHLSNEPSYTYMNTYENICHLSKQFYASLNPATPNTGPNPERNRLSQRQTSWRLHHRRQTRCLAPAVGLPLARPWTKNCMRDLTARRSHDECFVVVDGQVLSCW